MLERDIEQKLCAMAKARGGLAIKWTAPGMTGVPDRIVFMPGGRIHLVELKRPGERPTPLQARIHQMLEEMGTPVHIIDNVDKIRELLQ